MNHTSHILASLTLAGSVLAQEDATRTWTLDNGQTIQAAAISTPGDSIYLQKKEGRTLRIPLSRLSAQDHAYLRTWKKPAPPSAVPMLPHTMASDADSMPVHTWNIGNGQTVRASIQSLGPNDLVIRTGDDRLYNLQRNALTPQETAHVEEWKRLNSIRNWNVYCQLHSKEPSIIEASLSDAIRRTATLRLLDGSQTIYRFSQFKGEDLDILQAWDTPDERMEQTLVFHTDAAAAEADAKRHSRRIMLFLVGKKGSREESLCEQFIWSNPYLIEYLNKKYTLVRYYCDENGKWPEPVRFLLDRQTHHHDYPWHKTFPQLIIAHHITQIDYNAPSYYRINLNVVQPCSGLSIPDEHFPNSHPAANLKTP
ncbi:hypothetical protein ICN84_01405 [Akkermansia glycaniphila]|uniref:hypothetical protein n=1 Tax=Akkermansia glycaniphila TaxID=1679444 RepID=UPI001C03679B|nr:hypothetical protein [Akkermansia glycaniphila]MBT9448727.1 hypothetical protein [Akkermansia glycaniphila]